MTAKSLLYPESGRSLAVAGALVGAAAVGLAVLGNPPASGLCASCFLVNTAGALHLHGKASASYLRPELLGIVLGAFFAAFATREFRVRGGAQPLIHLVGGAFLVFGCEVFIGCPIKALLRTAGGGGTGLVGLAGLASGVLFAAAFQRDGFALADKKTIPEPAGLVLPGAAFLLLAASSAGAGTGAPGAAEALLARHAPFGYAAAAGLLFGAVGQRSRFCVTGSIRTLALAGDFREAAGTVSFLLAALALNLLVGAFRPTVALEPGAHTDLFWAFLAMAMVGFGAILVAGCPFRQIVLAATGDMDAAAAVAGMLAAAGLSVSLGVSSSPAGPTGAGKIAVLAGWIFFLSVGLWRRRAA